MTIDFRSPGAGNGDQPIFVLWAFDISSFRTFFPRAVIVTTGNNDSFNWLTRPKIDKSILALDHPIKLEFLSPLDIFWIGKQDADKHSNRGFCCKNQQKPDWTEITDDKINFIACWD